MVSLLGVFIIFYDFVLKNEKKYWIDDLIFLSRFRQIGKKRMRI